ncbi:polysaccharide pyruvyl transferase family protein [Phocaeicola plebeius]|jgi:hypothetical protein|uniref:Polysaccharide pyruvyl transferase family protein n=1 Tax=Phocaeicola plebeius TaxID=310297 RepID=A0A3E4W8H6_9BACT|nr:polysaccharide pyruvyl transferase family protein [Phocaeicola plebeius]RGM38497.1 polysaccharide pyruvyl transferase family protein [Phocaeicola plebeius]
MKKIGIITIHSDLNYGAFLQAFALTSFLRKNGYDASIIDYRKIPNHPRLYKFPLNIIYKLYNLPRLYRYRSFISPMLSKYRYNSLKELSSFNEEYDLLITGSDQIWNPLCGGLGKLNPAYFLAFAPNNRYKKIAYGSSVGSYIFNKEEQIQVKQWLNDFTHLSTRELAGSQQLESFLHRKVKVVLDPTLLIDKEEWLKYSKKCTITEKYVLVYYIDELDEVVSYARKIADYYGWKVALITNMAKKHPNVDIKIPHCGPAQFLWLFDKAEYIVTNSFHGTAFAINFNKDFISVIKRNSPQRAQTLLNNVGLPERLLTNIEDVDKLPSHINYDEPNKKLNELRQDSISYLLNAIEN